ncbi:hypothetical protein [Castellaniella sp.]|uniref:hypothetical protein n=1 Tax=Castellaniella sp. TaxID=1955812 RepID=UPI002B002833|nr:hypothetical protein [Castellaniella sp.]
MTRRSYFLQTAIAADQLANALLAGYADETLSSRAWRCRNDKRRWAIARAVIDVIFFWQEDHCMNAYLSELFRKQLPADYQETATSRNFSTRM